MIAALVMYLPCRERCLIHVARNVLAKVPKDAQAEVKADYWAIFELPEDVEPGLDAVKRVQANIDSFAKRWCDAYPGAVAISGETKIELHPSVRYQSPASKLNNITFSHSGLFSTLKVLHDDPPGHAFSRPTNQRYNHVTLRSVTQLRTEAARVQRDLHTDPSGSQLFCEGNHLFRRLIIPNCYQHV